ncbi:TRM11 family SAM-dependent methyltransferase [Brachybacterium sp. DNPG3]
MLVLRAPSANRVYAEAAGRLVLTEARWVLGARIAGGLAVRERIVGGMDALEIELPTADGPDATGPEAAGALDERTLRLLGSLSGTLGVLEIVDGGDVADELLRPLDPPVPLRHPSDLETILKYPGKTNEQFTALMINLGAALSTRRDALFDGTLRLLDPMCGRGTTLNRALRLGLSPVGAEIDRKDVEAYRTFLSTWLRSHRYKHTVDAGRLAVRGTVLGTRVDVELAEDRQAQRDGRSQTLTLLGCDTRELGGLLPDRSIDVIVADLPYGVQHGGRGGSGWSRSPLEVLAEAAPPWRRLLRDGGAMVLAVNRHTLAHDDASAVLADAGLRVVSPDGAFRHRVDQSIDRDILLAVPADHPRLEELTALGTDSERIR